ncbi:MAG: chemotaxis protein CheW [Planctomycetia bacterium]|nr:chemotaxis protein CheW [Planctomycetia bacterium]
MAVLVFEVGDKRFGVHSGNVREVVRAVKLSPLPEAPGIVEGLLNLRGQILPVVDVRRLFSLAPRKIRHTDYLIVVATDDRTFALHVDLAIDLIELPASDVQPANTALPQAGLVDVVAKTNDGLVHVLDVARLASLENAHREVALTASRAEGRVP